MVICDGESGAAVFSRVGVFHAATKGLGHQLHAVTYSEDGDPQAEYPVVTSRRAFGIDAGRASGEDYAPRFGLIYGFGCDRRGDYFAEDIQLSYLPGNELIVL